MDGFECEIPIPADERVQGLLDIAGLRGRFDIDNIRLDKCGGLTEALLMAWAQVTTLPAFRNRRLASCLLGEPGLGMPVADRVPGGAEFEELLDACLRPR